MYFSKVYLKVFSSKVFVLKSTIILKSKVKFWRDKMSLISLASGKSLWRGYEYYEGKRVHFHIQNGEFEYTGKVSGNGRSYDVHID